MKLLTTIANKHSSDKGTEHGVKHGFSEAYDSYFLEFKDKHINILEIGINDGASLKMWYEYFPNAFIYGLDIDDKLIFNNDRISCGILDQSNEDNLKYFAENINICFDIIIDDGSHHMKDQQITFGYLFPLLNSKGIYIIEDLHTSLCENNTIIYGKAMEVWDDKRNTTLSYLSSEPHISVYLNDAQNQYIQSNIKTVKIFAKENINVPNDYKNQSITSVIIKK